MKKLFLLLLLFTNICLGQVVISQIYGGGGNTGATYKNDFIVIFNRGNTTQNLSGWSVQYASGIGTTWATINKTNLPSFDLQPGQYYLIQQAAGTGGTTDLPTPDLIGNITMSATSGKVALVNNTTSLIGACLTSTSIVDFVGYGTTTNCSETLPTQTLSNTQCINRINNGCTDNNNNSTDFIRLTLDSTSPTPKNSL
jgi:hypothetical protein